MTGTAQATRGEPVARATKVFARTGASTSTPATRPSRGSGWRNLARALADANVIPGDSMQSLGAFVAAELGLSIDACM